MEDVDEIAWTWDSTPADDFRNFIQIDGQRRMLHFGGRTEQLRMVVVQGNQCLASNKYHCWTLHVSDLGKAELMVGVATQDADCFLGKWNSWCRIGRDNQSWALSSNGLIYHDWKAVQHHDYQINSKDYVTVHLDLIHRTLMFAINSKLIGFQFMNLPFNKDLFPVVGVAGKCSLQLVCSYVSQPSLRLISLLACRSHLCRTQSSPPRRKYLYKKFPPDSALKWKSLISVDGSFLPPGLKRDVTLLYPWFFEKYHSPRKQRNPGGNHSKNQSSLEVFDLAEPHETLKVPGSARRLERVIKKRSCACGSGACEIENALAFMRRRDINYMSSSDDEIFPDIAKRRKIKRKIQCKQK